MMDNDVQIDMDQITQVVEAAEVLVVGFALFPERLLLDFRHNPFEGPLIKMVPPVTSVEERLVQLKKLRPRFGAPERFMFFIWPKSVASFEKSGVWNQIVSRCLAEAEGLANMAKTCEDVYSALMAREKEEVVNALVGKNYETIWKRTT
ncbi:MAG: hypothetical protein HY664_07785 [Chloroflexi bacterium]|nr:hypothetical protein [Chloroflexota bacterium]